MNTRPLDLILEKNRSEKKIAPLAPAEVAKPKFEPATEPIVSVPGLPADWFDPRKWKQRTAMIEGEPWLIVQRRDVGPEIEQELNADLVEHVKQAQ